MRFLTARQIWHDAFLPDVTGIDYAALITGHGVMFTARGADNKIVDHCERGLVQHEIARLRERDFIAWCWGMIAYAPPGVSNEGHIAPLFGDLRAHFYAHLKPGHEFLALKYDVKFERQLKILCLAAIESAADTDCGRPARRSREGMADLLGLGLEDYNSRYYHRYKALKNHCEDLAPRALGAVAPLLDRFYVRVAS